MNLELNLVKKRDIYTKVYTSLARKRVLINNDTEAMDNIASFISDNIEVFDAAFSDKNFVTKLQSLSNLTIDSYSSLRYILSQNGLDVVAWIVPDPEINPEVVPDDMAEYNIVDMLDAASHFLKLCTKLQVPENNLNLYEVYSNIIDRYNFFNGELFEGQRNPFLDQLSIIKENMTLLGESSTASTTYLNSVLEFLGKEIYIIIN